MNRYHKNRHTPAIVEKSMEKNDVSRIPDSEMRPWADCKELDEAVERELGKVNDCLNLTSPSRNAGYPGSSDIDAQPPELIDFNNYVEQPGWMGSDEPEQDGQDPCTADATDLIDESDVQSIESSLIHDPVITAAIKKVNELTVNFNRTRLQMARLKTMRLLPIDTMIRVSSFIFTSIQ